MSKRISYAKISGCLSLLYPSDFKMQTISHKQKPIKLGTATALVIGAMLGGGIFALPATLAAFGSISLVAWVITAIGSILIALTFVYLNTIAPETGGAFLYTYKAYGSYMGFLIAVSYWFGWCVGCAAALVAVNSFLAPFWPILNEQSPQFSPLFSLAFKIFLVWLTIGLNMFGIRAVGKFQLLTNLIKISPLFVIAAMAMTKFNIHNITDFYNISGKSNWEALSSAAAITLFAFIGMEAAVVPSDDMASHRVIARATILGTVLVSLFYVFVTLALLGFEPASQIKNLASPFQSVGEILLGKYVAYWITFCAILTILGTVNGGIVIFAQDAMAASHCNILPKIFGDTNNRFNTPIKGIFISGIVMTILLFLTVNNSLQKQFNFLVLLCTLSLVIPYFVSSTAAMVLFMKDPNKLPKKQFYTAFTVALFSSMYAFWMIVGAGQEVVFYGSLFFFSIFWLHFIYVFTQRVRTKVVSDK